MKCNNVPYEGKMCSLIQQIPLPNSKEGNSSSVGEEESGGFFGEEERKRVSCGDL